MANNPEDIIRNARKLLSKGEINRHEYADLEEKLLSEMPMEQYVTWRDAGNLPGSLYLRGPAYNGSLN